MAAEAFAAAAFARAGYDVLVQYGANQPGYDLAVAGRRPAVKVSVKGSKDGGWVLTASHKKGRTYHEAIDHWRLLHSDSTTLFCFVQFKGVSFSASPRMYLARLTDVVEYMKASCGGHGYTSLREHYQWSSGKAAGTVDIIPASWTMSEARIAKLVGPPSGV